MGELKLFGLIYEVYPKKFELFWAWLLKKPGMVSKVASTGIVKCLKLFANVTATHIRTASTRFSGCMGVPSAYR